MGDVAILRFTDVSSGTNSFDAMLDNVVLFTTPEPGTLTLLALGGLGLLRRRRR